MEKIQEKKNVYFTPERKARLIPALLIALAVPFMLFLVSPLEIYANGMEEFTFGLFDFYGFSLLFFVVISALNFVALFFTPKIVFRVLYALGIAIFLMLFLQINFLNLGLNTLAGDEADGGTQVKTSTFIINTVIWAIVLIGAVTAFIVVKKPVIKAAVCLMLSVALLCSQLVNFAVVAVKAGGDTLNSYETIKKEDPNFQPTFLTTKNLTTVSENKNVIVFCIDRFDVKFAEEGFKKCSEIYNSLEGFTYYKDNISMYGHTYPAVAHMLTDIEKDYSLTSTETRKQYFANAYGENKTLSALANKNYQINLYTEEYDAYYNAYYMPSYVANTEQTTFENLKSTITPLKSLILAARMTQIAFYRSMPYALKDVFGNVSSNTCNDCVKVHAGGGMQNDEYSSDLKAVYDQVSTEKFTLNKEQNVFSFIHVTGCHSIPYNTDWSRARLTEDDITISLKNSFAIINAYISQMKELGVYDNATIIITGDHADPVNDLEDLDGVRNTALFVKKSGETEGTPLTRKSTAQTSHADLWATIFDSEGISGYQGSGTSVFKLKENENRTRKYVWSSWSILGGDSFTTYTYEINGNGLEFSSWTKKSETEFLHNYYK